MSIISGKSGPTWLQACFIYLKDLKLFCVSVRWLDVYLCTTHMHVAYSGQKRVSDPLKLRLQTVMSYYVGVKN